MITSIISAVGGAAGFALVVGTVVCYETVRYPISAFIKSWKESSWTDL